MQPLLPQRQELLEQQALEQSSMVEASQMAWCEQVDLLVHQSAVQSTMLQQI